MGKGKIDEILALNARKTTFNRLLPIIKRMSPLCKQHRDNPD
jgi:hypothetical protein